MKLRQLLSCLLSLACLLSASASAQGNQAYPDKPIRLIVGYAPGGATDIVARMLAQELTPILGQSGLLKIAQVVAHWSARTPSSGRIPMATIYCLARMPS